MTRTSTLILAAILMASAPSLAGTTRLNLLEGELHRGVRVTGIDGKTISFTDEKGVARKAPVEDVVDLAFAGEALPNLDPGPADVAVLLRGGDIVNGRLVPGKEEHLSLSSPLLGRLLFPLDDIAEIRFLEAWGAAVEKPAAPRGELLRDVFFYRNLDRVEGTFLKITPREVVAHTRISESYPIQFEKLLAIRFADAPEPKAPEGRIAVLLLADGSRITAKSLSSDGSYLKAKTIRGGEIEVTHSSLLALYQTGGKFVYLSDLEPSEEKIVPWMGEEYAWDRPRYDRSFLDRPLSAGGETYQKGIGVISGTSLTWRIAERGFKRFTSRLALDDAAGAEGDVVFEVLVDGEPRFKSQIERSLATGESPARIPPLDIEGAKEITLRVTYVDDFVNDFADWLDPMLVR